MDANGTRFHLLLGKPDWGRCILATVGTQLNHLFELAPLRCQEAGSGFEWDPKKAELTLRSCVFEFRAAAADRRPVLSDRRGAAADQYGNFYWIDGTAREIRVKSQDNALPSTFWPLSVERETDVRKERGEFAPIASAAAPPPAVQFSALAITDDHYLVVGTIEPAGLLIFDLHAGGPPTQVCWPREVPFTPFDMVRRAGGGVWILDREHLSYWALDRHLNVVADEQAVVALVSSVPDDFQSTDQFPTHSTPARWFPGGIAFELASPVTATVPISIEALPDDTVLILGRDPEAKTSAIYRYRSGRQVGPALPLRDGLMGHDFVFVPDPKARGPRLGLLFLVGDDGNEAHAFVLTRDGDALHLERVPEYLPMRLFGGKALMAAGPQVYYDLGDVWVPLVEQRRPRYVREAALATIRFDGRDPDCVWHRLLLDACLPPTTGVSVESRAANDERDLEQTAWTQEPRLYLRSASELPFVSEPIEEEKDPDEQPPPTAQPVLAPSTGEGRGTWELLFQRARGRFLQLRLTLTGDGRTTPRLRALRAYYPRFSYLEHYLPAVYRDDEQSASFLDRFLANVEGFYTALEDRIASAQILFDVRSAPAETLEWLASWFGVVLDPSWNEVKRRLFIRHAMDFFQYRGTVRGLIAAARLATEPCADEGIFASPGGSGGVRASRIRIVEKYRTRRTPGVVFGDPTDTGPRLVPLTGGWRPEQGRSALRRRYMDVVQNASDFPIKPPAALAATTWRQFATDTLGFVPSASSADASAWHDFLARRYRRVSALNSAYKLTPQLNAFSDAQLPAELPPDGPALQDWYQFESVVLPMRRTAHRFTILLPRPSASASPVDQRRVLDLTRRVIELEKPAGAVFDVKFYWGMFRVGEARLGDDTLIDLGGRAPELMTPMTLGQGHLSESFLAPGETSL